MLIKKLILIVVAIIGIAAGAVYASITAPSGNILTHILKNGAYPQASYLVNNEVSKSADGVPGDSSQADATVPSPDKSSFLSQVRDVPVPIELAGFMNITADMTLRPMNASSMEEATVINIEGLKLAGSGAYNVRDYGASGDGVTFDNEAIQNAIEAANAGGGGTVYIPDGAYLIDVSSGIGLTLKSNVNLYLSSNAILQAQSCSLDNYRIIIIRDASDVGVIGGKIIGDADTRDSTSGGGGHGIAILGSSNVYIADITVTKCWGDGIYIGVTAAQNYSSDITIERFNISYSRRNNISVISAKNLTIKNGTLSSAGGMANAGAGIDVEPNNNTHILQNIQIKNTSSLNNAVFGLKTSFAKYARTPNPVSITVTDYTGSFNNWCEYRITNHGIVIKINGKTYTN